MPLYLTHPQWLDPEIIPGLPFRWYGLMYIVAFAITMFLFWRQVKKQKLEISSDSMISFFLSGIIGLLVGARVIYMLVYAMPSFLANPLSLVWPFDAKGTFIGFQGMSFHGGLVGLIVGFMIYAKVRKLNLLAWCDLVAVAAPLGYTFGRLGNFINGELWGRATSSPIGMVFPSAETFDAAQPWVAAIAKDAGMDASGVVNLPRHPSQLYEAFFEGIVLWAILWFLLSKKKPFEGWIVGWYLIGYGFFRFVIEYFREPDRDIGYVLNLAPSDLPPAVFTSVLNISMGQILCFLMMGGGAALLIILSRRKKRGLLSGGPAADALGAPAADHAPDPAVKERNSWARKLRKKVK